MKKLFVLLVLTASASLLQADCGGGRQGPYNQGPYPQGQYQQNPYSQQQYSQGQYQQNPYSQQQYPQGQYQQNPYSQQQYLQGPQGGSQRSFGGQSPQEYQQGKGYQGYNQGGGAQNSDQQLTKDIQDSLRSAFTSKYNNVRASVNNGTVTLTGSVATQEDKNNLEEKVRDMDGVTNVNNQVMVQGKGEDKGQQQPGQHSQQSPNQHH